jgi:choice-of-anchor B domain-containing protein
MTEYRLKIGNRPRPILLVRLGFGVLLGSSLLPVAVTAHEGPTPFHYVAENGRDEGTCERPSNPCRTIAYALSKAGKGDEVRVAAGTYEFQPGDPAEVVQLLSPIIVVRGGYDAGEGFANRDVAANPTIVVGPAPRYARDLEQRGLLIRAQAEGQGAGGGDPSASSLATRGVTRYVAPSGRDEGDCTDPEAACASITYALAQAQSGDTVLIAVGDYAVPPEAVDALLRPDITVRGGYIRQPAFAAAAPATQPSYVTGPSHERREELAARGLTLIQDRKGATIEESIATPPAPLAAAQAFTPCDLATGMAGVFPCHGVDLLAHMPLASFSSQPQAANDIWGFVDRRDGREYAFIGLLNGTAVVDLSDPRTPREVGTIRGQNARWRDIKIYQFQDQNGRWQAYAYVTADFPDAPQGLQIIDLTGLPASISLAATYDGITRAHNIYIANVDYTTGEATPGLKPYAYILGSNKASGAAHALDLANPTALIEVLTPVPGTQYAHDASSLVITDARTAACRSGMNPPAGGHNPCEVLIDFNEDTLDLWDVTDKAKPLRLSSTPYPEATYTHSGWWSKDRQFVFVQDELDEQDRGLNTTLRTFDIGDIGDLTNPLLTNVWSGPERNIDHNGFVVGDRYYMSAYRRGLMILDITDPNDPRETGFFDTFPSPAANTPFFNGAWGVYPFLPSRTLVVSDIEGGLFVLKEK